jgi:hypothetical protein
MQQVCKNLWCHQTFDIADSDLQFLEKVSPIFNGKKELIPPPTLCPQCRMQRRLAFRNERSLYKQTCDLTKKEMISMYPEESPYVVYSKDAWFGDGWDPLSYGRAVDLSRPFWPQFGELMKVVPKMSLIQQANMENADYCNRASNDKNCYMIFTSNFSEDCYYSVHLTNCRNCVDCLNVHKSERCYECVDSYECYDCRWVESCKNCTSSAFLKGCTGCSDCMFCTNLTQKKFCIDNNQYSEEEYRSQLAGTTLHVRSTVELLKKRFSELKKNMIVREYMGMQNENVRGNYIDHCKNVLDAFEVRESEDCRYVQSLVQAKDCMDYASWGRGCELIYETINCGYNCRNVLFSNECWDSNTDLICSNQCLNCSHCFGCCGLRYKKFCILNKQYSEAEYNELVPQIIQKMRTENEYGEFIPTDLSPFAYNETNAQDYVPLNRNEAKEQDWRWLEEDPKERSTLSSPLPDDIGEVSDDLCEEILLCGITSKKYKIVPQELSFYRSIGVPVPDKCFDERQRERFALQTPRKLWSRKCGKCGKEIVTSFMPERTEMVYCEECYLREVY